MGYYTFGGGAAEVATDTTGNVQGGVQFQVWSKYTGGIKISDLQSVDGTALPGYVTSEAAPANPDDLGRISFLAPDSYQVVYLDRGYGDRWAIMAREVWTQVGTAIDAYGQAISTSQAAADRADALATRVDQFQDTVDNAPLFGLDITKLSASYVTQLGIPAARVVQSFAKDPATGDYYAAQTSGTDTLIYRCAADGTLLDSATLTGAGHGTSIDIERSGSDVYVWTWWSNNPGGTLTPTVVRWPYEGGQTVTLDDPTVEAQSNFERQYTVVTLDVANDRIATWNRDTTAGTETFKLRKLSEFKQGIDNVLYTIGPGPMPDGDFQGFQTVADRLYVSRGGLTDTKTSPPSMTRYEWSDGTSTVVNISSYGARPDGTFAGGHNEPEGVAVWVGASGKPSLLFGKVSGPAGARRSAVFAFTPVGGDELSSSVVQRLDQGKQKGVVSITPVPNQPTMVHVDYEWEFPAVPNPIPVIESSVPGSGVYTPTIKNKTTTGFDLYVYRTNDTPTVVSWTAFV